jgi:glucosylceramidase
LKQLHIVAHCGRVKMTVTSRVLLAGCAALCAVGSSAIQVKSWLTTADPVTGAALKLLEAQEPIDGAGFTRRLSTDADFGIDISSTKQKIIGYGAGLPQASASVLFNLKERSAELYNAVVEQLFTTSNGGAGINILRFPIGSCDFSIHNTSYDEHENDYDLENFAIDDDSKMIVEVLKDALAVNPGLVIIGTCGVLPSQNPVHIVILSIGTAASPWSAPSWLKTFDTLIAYSEKNTLLSTEAAYTTYARYFANVLKAYRREGLTIQYFTLQNEPLFGTSDQYPGMYFTSEQAVKLGQFFTQGLTGQQQIEL